MFICLYSIHNHFIHILYVGSLVINMFVLFSIALIANNRASVVRLSNNKQQCGIFILFSRIFINIFFSQYTSSFINYQYFLSFLTKNSRAFVSTLSRLLVYFAIKIGTSVNDIRGTELFLNTFHVYL